MVRRALLVAAVLVAALALTGLSGWLPARRLAAGQRPVLVSGSLVGAGSFGSCCGGGRLGTSATSGTTATGAPAATGLSALEQAAVSAYRAATGDQSAVELKVTDFGCHMQADIYKDGQRVRSYVLRNGQWQEIR